MLIFIALSFFVVAEPTTVQVFDGLRIAYPQNSIFKQYEDITLQSQVYDDTGVKYSNTTATCDFSLYNSSGSVLINKTMNYDGNNFYTVINNSITSNNGRYTYIIQCATTGKGAYISRYFTVTTLGNYTEDYNQNLTPIGMMLLLPLLLSLIMLIGAATLDGDVHAAMKIGLFLLSSIPFYISLYWGSLVITHYYNIPLLTDAIADGVFWLGIMFVVIITYFIINAFYLLVKQAAQKKEEKLNY
jgi:hypothetical protein